MPCVTESAVVAQMPPQRLSFNLIFDRLLMLEQLGLAPAPAPAS
jgi:hypothetical protein